MNKIIIIIGSIFCLHSALADDSVFANQPPQHSTTFTVKCDSVGSIPGYTGSSDVMSAYMNESGTTITQKDNTIIKYSPSVPCRLTLKTVIIVPQK